MAKTARPPAAAASLPTTRPLALFVVCMATVAEAVDELLMLLLPTETAAADALDGAATTMVVV